MKAAVFREAGKPLSIESVPDPTPVAGQVVLKVGRCGICGTDLSMTEGQGMMAMPSGFIPGHEYAGEVVAVGSGVANLKPGDRVAAMPFQGCGQCAACLSGSGYFCEKVCKPTGAAFAEYALASATDSIKLPSSLALQDGALIEPLAVGLHGVRISGMSLGAKALVIGAGSIGLAAAYYARRLGAGQVFMLASSRRRESQAMAMGVDSFIVPGEGEDPVAAASAAMGGMPDIVFEAAGVPGTIAQAINHVRPRGTVVVLGCCTLPDQFVPALPLLKEVRLQFSMVYDITDFEYVARLLDAGNVEPRGIVTQVVTFAELPEAFEALRHRSPQCKVMLAPNR